MQITWAIFTGEYPPQPGGVSDYTRQLAEALAAAGDIVHVFAPFSKSISTVNPRELIDGVNVFRIVDSFRSKGRAQIDSSLRSMENVRILVQYAPHAFGRRGMNIGFARWVNRLARRSAVDVMFHEVLFPMSHGQPPPHRLLAIVTRWMAIQLGRNAKRRFISTPRWEQLLHEIGVAGPTIWAPVPTNLPIRTAPNLPPADEPRKLRIGHFGTYGPHTSPEISKILLAVQQSRLPCDVILLGRGGDAFVERLIADHPQLGSMIKAPGELDAAATTIQICKCDLMVQWYPDGISTRRTSTMAAIALGVPVICNQGISTESLWSEFDAVALIDNGSAEAFVARISSLAANREARQALGERGRLLYESRFDLSVTVEALRSL